MIWTTKRRRAFSIIMHALTYMTCPYSTHEVTRLELTGQQKKSTPKLTESFVVAWRFYQFCQFPCPKQPSSHGCDLRGLDLNLFVQYSARSIAKTCRSISLTRKDRSQKHADRLAYQLCRSKNLKKLCRPIYVVLVNQDTACVSRGLLRRSP
jgi:hypothetical protein